MPTWFLVPIAGLKLPTQRSTEDGVQRTEYRGVQWTEDSGQRTEYRGVQRTENNIKKKPREKSQYGSLCNLPVEGAGGGGSSDMSGETCQCEHEGMQ